MSDPRRVAAHLAEELAAAGAAVPRRDECRSGGRSVVVCDLPRVVTFATDGWDVWWQVRGRPYRYRHAVADGGLALIRHALVAAVYTISPPRLWQPALDTGDEAAARCLAGDVARHLPGERTITVSTGQPDEGSPLVRVDTGSTPLPVQVRGGWFAWPDPYPDLEWHAIGLRGCLHHYRHVAVARLVELARMPAPPRGLAPGG